MRQNENKNGARWLALLVGPALVANASTACHGKQESAPGSASASSTPSPAATGSVRRPKHEALVDERVDIPGGAFFAGSLPGEAGRQPELEPRRYEVELGPFQMDRLPYPNDPTQPFKTGVTRDQAAKLCGERGARLCTELEWERACKGPESDPFPTGNAWDGRCAEEVRTCATGFDVLGQAAALREWTASDVIASEKDIPPRAAVRGAPAQSPAQQHRCAARTGIDPETRSDDLGFRCCKGPPNAAKVKEPTLGETFEKLKISAERLEKLLASDEETRSIAHDIKFFREPDAANTVVARGPGDRKGFSFTVSPLLWRPVAGAEYLVVTGRSGEKTSFVLAFYVVGKDDYKLASSFIMKDEPGPVAFAYSQYIRPRLHFSSCWGCPGETGKILFRNPDEAVILQP